MAKCIVCKGDYKSGRLCDRCRTDNTSWERWRASHSGLAGWADFLQHGGYLPVGLTALIGVFGIIGSPVFWGSELAVWPVMATVVATGACAVIIGLTYRNRNRLRERELLNQVRRGRLRLLGARFQAAIVPILALMPILTRMLVVLLRIPRLADGEESPSLLVLAALRNTETSPYSTEVLQFVLSVQAMGLTFGYFLLPMMALVFTTSIYLALDYAERMNREVPSPIFLNTAHLARLVREQAKQECTSLGRGLIWEGMERTDDGGIKLTARCLKDRKIVEDLAGKKSDLPLHTTVEVVADPWGRIRSIAPESGVQM